MNSLENCFLSALCYSPAYFQFNGHSFHLLFLTVLSFPSCCLFLYVSVPLPPSLSLPLHVTPLLYIDFCIADVPEPCSFGGAAEES